jgi:RNA polymerase-binding transcription factor DksA
LTGRDLDQVETLLRERSAGLRRTRTAVRNEAEVLSRSLIQHPHAVAQEPMAAPEEPAPTGSCSDCGDSIPAGRLRAIPAAVRCAGCQRELESRTV